MVAPVMQLEVSAASFDRQGEIDRLIERARELRHKDVAQAVALSQRAYEESSVIGYLSGQGYSLRNLAHGYILRGNYESALMRGLEGVQLFEKLADLQGLAQMSNVVSRIQWELGDYLEALKFTLRFLDLAKALDDVGMQADALNNLAGIYHQLGQLERALGIVKQALELHRATGKLRGQFFSLNNIALLNHQTGRAKEALEAGHACVRMANKANSAVYKCKIFDTLGIIYTDSGKYDQALAYLMKGDKLAGEHDLKRDQLHARLNIGRIYHQLKRPNDALHYLTLALASAETLDTKQPTADLHKILSEVYESCGQLGPALSHHKRFHELHITLFNEQSDHKLKQLEVRHRTESARKEAEIYRQRSAELEIANDQAERARQDAETASQAKSEFLSNMSHELRTPLNGILGYAQILDRDERLLAEQADAVRVIRQSGEHLLLLINDILDIAKIEARKVELRPDKFVLPTFLNGVANIIQMRACQKRIDFRVEMSQLPQHVIADEKRLRQVLLNLLGNAVKFTRHGQVVLRVQHVESLRHVHDTANGIEKLYSTRDEARLRFEVEDTGCGVASADLARIFLPFEQVGGLHLRAEGTGLGLAISQQLVGLMGGKIDVESRLGKGSSFSFEILLPVSGSEQYNESWEAEPMSLDEPRLTLPSESDLTELEALVLLGDFSAIEVMCDALAAQDTALQPFAEQMRFLAHNFEEEAIWVLLAEGGCGVEEISAEPSSHPSIPK